ncbi:hypothetical protein [Alcanivorax sp.]|uniref:hypothetical protein n=1 Tax=Alcanivorax sp. TaxID=1872427 RepID=UPI003BAC0B3C
MLGNFNWTTRVSPSDAHIDKLDITLKEWIVRCDPAQITNLMSSLGSDFPAEHRPSISGNHFFYASQSSNSVIPSTSRIPLRKSHNNYLTSLSGTLAIKPRALQEDGHADRIYSLSLNASLNATRFGLYQDIPRIRVRSSYPPEKRDLSNQPYRLFKIGRKTVRANGERSLDGNDNVGLTAHSKSVLTHIRWQSLTENAISCSLNVIDNELDLALDNGTEISYEFQSRIITNRVEFYWEYWCEGPISTIAKISDALKQTHQEFSETTFICEEEGHRNALSVRATHRRGVDIKFYAKTNRRIRVEATLKVREHPDLINLAGCWPDGGRRRETNSTEQTVRLLNSLSTLAADSVNQLLGRLQMGQRRNAAFRRSPIAFITGVYEICSPEFSRELLHAIANNRGIHTAGLTLEQLTQLDGLVRAGILARPTNTERGWYSLSPQFSYIPERLRP